MRHAQERMQWDVEGRSQGRGGDAATSQETPKMATDHQKLGERHGTDFPSQPCQVTNAASRQTHLSQTSGLQDGETMNFCC